MSSSDQISRVSEADAQENEEIESDGESNISSIAESIKEGVPENLKQIFESKDVHKANSMPSLFSKTNGAQVNSANVQDEKMAKAEAIFQKFALFGQAPTKPIKADVGIRGR